MYSKLLYNKRECIPVGCVPPAAVANCWGVSASVQSGIPTPRCGLGDPPGCEPGDPPRCGPGDPPQAIPLNFPLGVGLETPPGQIPQLPPGCGPGDLQCMLGYHPPPWTETCNAWWDTTPSPDRMTDTCKNITVISLSFICALTLCLFLHPAGNSVNSDCF